MKCQSCGAENADNAAFCAKCGAKFDTTISSTATPKTRTGRSKTGRLIGTGIVITMIALASATRSAKRISREHDRQTRTEASVFSLTQTEKAIVGTWTFATSMDIDPDDEDDASSVYLEGEETYRKDRTFRETGIYKFKFIHDGEITILEYGFSGKGTWKANEKRLVETENGDDFVFTFKSASSYPKDSGDRQYIASLRDIVEDQFRATLFELNDETTYVIKKLTNDRMVLVDDDGDETTYRRKK